MLLFRHTPLSELFGLITVVGVVAFIAACWRNIKNDKWKDQK